MKIWLLNDTSRVEHLIGFKLSQMCQYVKCVKSEALAMIKGWSYLSKGAILVASSTCDKNTNIKRNAKAKASVTFLKINHAKIQHKQVSSCDSARPTKTIIIINFVRLRHLFH